MMKLSEVRVLYREWLGRYKDNCISMDWREYFRQYQTEQELAAKDAKIAELEMVILGMTKTLDEFFVLAEKTLKGVKP